MTKICLRIPVLIAFIATHSISTVKSFGIRFVMVQVNAILDSTARSNWNSTGLQSSNTSAVFLEGSSGQWSANSAPDELLLPNPSPSVSSCCDLCSGNASPELDHPSMSLSGQPSKSVTEYPASIGHWSPLNPALLSPNPSLSVSSHWVGSRGRKSTLVAHESPSSSIHPIVPFVELPTVNGQ